VQPYGETLEEVKALRRTWTFMVSGYIYVVVVELHWFD